MPALSSTTELIDLLRQSGIYQAGAFDDAMTKVPDLPTDPSRAAAVCVQRGVLTRFQAKLLLNGKSKGFRLGPYVILDQLGQGGMGTVFLAEHTTLRRQVALKVLNPAKDAYDSQVATERFLREARSAAALDHPNIVRIHDVAQQGSVHYIALEYVDGPTLDQLIQKGGPITPSRAVGYIVQAAAGLQHADERGFVHRDIKPSNLILTKDQKTLKILDMGLARSFTNEADKLTEQFDNGVVTGTVDFISPEQSLGSSDLDIRSDIYSLGATFFTLLTGKPPFQGNTTQKLAQHQIKPAPDLAELDPTLPKGLATVVSKMLAKKPKDRYQTPNDLIAVLGQWLGGNSRTNLAVNSGMTDTLMSGTTLGTSPTERQEPPATEQLGEPEETEQITTAKGHTSTRRTTRRRKKKQEAAFAAMDQKKKMMIGGGVLGVLLVIIGGVFAFSGGKKPADQTANNTPTNNNPPANNPPKNNPNPNPKQNPPSKQNPPVKLPANAGDLLYHADFRDIQTASRAIQLGEKAFAQQVGNQNLPLGWAINHHETTTAADYMISDVSGTRAMGVRHIRGGRTEILCRIDNVINTQRVGESRVYRVEYQFEGTGVANVGVKLEKEPYTKLVLEQLAPTNGAWQQVDITFTRSTADPIVFICNLGPDPKASGDVGTLWIRSLDVSATRTAAAPSNSVNAGEYAAWQAKSAVYKLDLASIDTFQVTKEGGKLQMGTAERLPKGIRAMSWKPTATAEFRCESIDGSKALGVANLSDEKAAQITFDLERDMNIRLSPGKVYRVTVEYTTQKNATGGLLVQTTDAGYRSILNVPLNTSEGVWKKVSGEFQRQDAEPIRLNLDNFSVGEGNILYIRSLEVAEVTKP